MNINSLWMIPKKLIHSLKRLCQSDDVTVWPWRDISVSGAKSDVKSHQTMTMAMTARLFLDFRFAWPKKAKMKTNEIEFQVQSFLSVQSFFSFRLQQKFWNASPWRLFLCNFWSRSNFGFPESNFISKIQKLLETNETDFETLGKKTKSSVGWKFFKLERIWL